MKKRVEITLKFSADLDQVPGWGHEPKDWIDLVKRELTRNDHYNTQVDMLKVEVTQPAVKTDGESYFEWPLIGD
jgi:hypothetical protein